MRSTIEYHSRVGPLTLLGEGGELLRLEFHGRPGSSPPNTGDGVLRLAATQLDEYFAGARHGFQLPLAPHGTPFQQRVWELLLAIPYGETTTYGALARELTAMRAGRTCEPRAIAGAVARTPIPIIIPCHRVIAADGSLRGYLGGLARKRRLLDFEASGGDPRALAA